MLLSAHAVTPAKQARLQELVDCAALLVDMPSLADPSWLGAGEGGVV